jgi:hypothetical protein
VRLPEGLHRVPHGTPMSRGRTGALLTLPPPPGNPGDPAGPLWSVTRALPVSTSRNWCLLAQESQETPVSGSGHQFLGVRAEMDTFIDFEIPKGIMACFFNHF